MNTLKRYAICVGTFALAALVGPVVQFATWPSLEFERRTSPSLSQFVQDVVFLLWPAQPLAVMEVSIGRVMAALLSVGVNILLFSMLGVAVVAASTTKAGLTAMYALVCVMVALLSAWGAGFDLAQLSFPALLAASLFYAIPFWLALRFCDLGRGKGLA